ncbi:hypothetical protein SAMN06272735_2384 [Streptomyces sp. TLI_55]|uniref:hypothetical protein n=1 Tax=Streptomyces sp. TLI_55 TaxID=1938861 RepID=UPI000BD7B579|nr:hypothetical protein [Streptomyces sp. TLI_55]SNX57908.1 hypothetical protein SAMN06272735_2384 [Streptomyces sp. TLI_55]
MSGSLWLPPGARPDTFPTIPKQRTTPSWAGPDPVDELAARLDDFVAAAVHPDEIAALLESDGLSDDQIRERYGVKNSFALAEELYERAARRHPEPRTPPHDPWRISLLTCLLRGVLFALPGLAYVLGAADALPLLAAALTGWTWNQGLAHRAYTWLGLGDERAAKRSLLLGAPAGVVLGAVVAWLVSGRADGAMVFAAGQSLYLGASTILLVRARERALLVALSPMATGAILTLLHPVPNAARLTLLLASLLTVTLLASLEVVPQGCGLKGRGAVLNVRLPPRGRDQPPPTRRQRTSQGPPLIASFPYALFGLATGTLVLHAALTDNLTALVLTLSMGPAEYLLHRLRSSTLTALRSTTTPTTFRRTTTRTLLHCLTTYLLTLLALALTTGIGATPLLLLGAVLWTALLLQSFGAILSTTLICSTAALAQTLALLTHTGSPHTVALTVYATAATAQAALSCALLGKATAHR